MIEVLTVIILMCQVNSGNARGYYNQVNKQYERNCQKHFIECVQDKVEVVKKDKKVDFAAKLVECIQEETSVGSYY